MKPLQNTIAVVTGASRGAGRGIAYELGEAGATVYVTGRSIEGSTTDNRQPTGNNRRNGRRSHGTRGEGDRRSL
ncbi:SDR family NAD(P)-dependent oxidoreductase [Rossellomorea marisflavi]|uniref:SDR family NAD(P)-dependent oxidoreductase n=1 Tax=Rossellomorea marisflavi TaxID=189381 RepID=UPI0022B13491|nr:SDR family NAD(P)-dependent oxidoreductase [Rossellomorea marisflavi]